MPEQNAQHAGGNMELQTLVQRQGQGGVPHFGASSFLQLVPVDASPVSIQEPLLNGQREDETPPWLRPFLSLRAQLTISFGIVLGFTMVLFFIIINQRLSMIYTVLATIGILVVVLAIAFVFISMLLRPLMQVTDAAQAIALGDFKQRERLPMRLPPQDEIDRLAGSIDEMVTRLETAEELRLSSEQSFRRFFTDASHQLRTPLTSLRGFTEVLMRVGHDEPETMQRVLKRMKSEAERMTLLINDLLMLARLDDTRLFKTQYTDLVELANERIGQIKLKATDDRVISLVLSTEKELGVQGDRERLKQLLFILLDNALKYGQSAPDGSITLQLDRQNGHAIVRVINNGEGIAAEDISHIFEAFYRGKYRTTTQTVMGAGLGLTIAERIVHLHKGLITVASSEAEGTVFTVTLPCA